MWRQLLVLCLAIVSVAVMADTPKNTLPDGSLLISDDYAGVIYRVTYNK